MQNCYTPSSVYLIWLYVLVNILFIHPACANDSYYRGLHYIDLHKELAIAEMQRSGIPASIKLAQAMLETNYGNSRLALEGNNHFGIKCKSYWLGDTILVDDDAPQECFRRYPSVQESYFDHSEFLQYHWNGHYQHLFIIPSNDYEAWAWGLQNAGYATNPNYAEGLIRIIKRFELHQFDKMEMSVFYTPPQAPERPNFIYDADVSQHHSSYNKHDKPLVDRVETMPWQQKKQTAKTKKVKEKKQPTEANTVHSKIIINTVEGLDDALKLEPTFINGKLALNTNNDTFLPYVASKYNVKLKKLYQYNEAEPGQRFRANIPIFLEKKAKKAPKGIIVHLVKGNEQLFEVAQLYGIKQRKLQKINKLNEGEQLITGQLIYLH